MEENNKNLNNNVLIPCRLIKPSRNIKGGIIGLTNVGKTSIFNLLTNSNEPTDESIFCTIGIEFSFFFFLFDCYFLLLFLLF